MRVISLGFVIDFFVLKAMGHALSDGSLGNGTHLLNKGAIRARFYGVFGWRWHRWKTNEQTRDFNFAT